ncbi:MAG: bifunctional UDP-4-keto-pentose/UDP-xylose synthase [Anaerolineae bacterium]|jgi:UDP-apiose/xylose synthase
MVKVLVLGAGGFIGAHLTERLLAEAHSVIGVDTHADKIREFLGCQQLDFLEQDIRQPGFGLDELVRDADVAVDLIAYANPGMYVKRPLDVFELNFIENLKIAEACVRQGKRLIQFSSCEVYGKTVANIVPEKLIDPEDPSLATFSEDSTDYILGPVSKHRWIYACAKQLLERVLHAYGLQGDLNYTIVRPFNFIGPKIDYLPSETDGVPRVFSFFMEALLEETAMRLVNGGTQRRCYTYIDDATECIHRIVENRGHVCDRQIFNVGSPQNEISIRGLAELMCRIFHETFGQPKRLLPHIVDVSGEAFYGEGYDDSDRRIPDIAKARNLLGWEPQVGLREALELTMRYHVAEDGMSRAE